jgi:hypothetical protein
VVFRPTQRNRRGGQDREEDQRKARGVSGRAVPHHGEDAQEGSDKGIHGEVTNRMGPRRDRKDNPRHYDGGHEAEANLERLEPQSGVSPGGSQPVQGVPPAVPPV